MKSKEELVIDNNIKESYCSFEVSKLLKEKGFECECHGIWLLNTQRKPFLSGQMLQKDYFKGLKIYNEDKVWLVYKNHSVGWLCPTHALAIEWLRINFDINIHDYHIAETDTWGADVYKLVHDYNKTRNGDCLLYSPILNNETLFKSPQEAIEASLLKVLKELI